MASIDWPTSLGDPLHQGFAQRRQSAVIRSPMGYGPAKVRRRTTASIHPTNVSLTLTRSMLDDLETFYHTTTEEGVLPFNWTDQIADTAAVFRFTAPPQYRSVGPELWGVVLNFEILPDGT